MLKMILWLLAVAVAAIVLTQTQTQTQNEKTENTEKTMPQTNFTQLAVGTFTFRQRPGTPHCGPTTSSLPVSFPASYEVRITADETVLDKDGFLIDNLFFEEYFSAFKDSQISISCERLAKLIAEDFMRMLPTCSEVAVCLEAVPGVRITAKVSSIGEKRGAAVDPYVLDGRGDFVLRSADAPSTYLPDGSEFPGEVDLHTHNGPRADPYWPDGSERLS